MFVYVSLISFVMFSVLFTIVFAPLVIPLIPLIVVLMFMSGVVIMVMLLMAALFYWGSNSDNAVMITYFRPWLIYLADLMPPSVGISETKGKNSENSTWRTSLISLVNKTGELVNKSLCSVFEMTYLPSFAGRRAESRGVTDVLESISEENGDSNE